MRRPAAVIRGPRGRRGGAYDARMDVIVAHSPSFSTARCKLAAGERVIGEHGAMVACSTNVELAGRISGGAGAALKRVALGGHNLFTTAYTAASIPGWVEFAAALPGDVVVVDLADDEEWAAALGSWLASEETVAVDRQWAGAKSVIAGEGPFTVKLKGPGKALIAAYGAATRQPVAAFGMPMVVDTGHLAAWRLDSSYDVRRAVPDSAVESLKTGEGYVVEFEGPSDFIVQSRSRQQLAIWNQVYDKFN